MSTKTADAPVKTNAPASAPAANARKPIPGTEAIPLGADGKINFDALGGEKFVGLNVLNIEVGETDGPFVLEKIEQKEFGVGKNKKMLPQYSAMKGTTSVIMPISASFIKKAEEAKLSPGDTFYVKRDRNFTSRDFGTENCKSFLIAVTGRA
jgi:hypothetical protein